MTAMTDVKNRIENLPVSDRIGSRTTRRSRVVAIYAGYGLLCIASAGTLVEDKLVHVVALVAYIASIVAIFAGSFMLMGRTTINAPNISAGAFDERERERRNDAIQRSFPLIGLSVAVCFVYAIFAEMLFPAIRSFGLMSLMLTGTLLLAMTLPTAMLAWTEPDPIDGEA